MAPVASLQDELSVTAERLGENRVVPGSPPLSSKPYHRSSAMESLGGRGRLIFIKGWMTICEGSRHSHLPQATLDSAELWGQASGMCKMEMSRASNVLCK